MARTAPGKASFLRRKLEEPDFGSVPRVEPPNAQRTRRTGLGTIVYTCLAVARGAPEPQAQMARLTGRGDRMRGR